MMMSILTVISDRDGLLMKFKALGALAGLALLAACSSPPAPTATAESSGAAATGAAPGSEQDLVANVGDRVFFDTNQSTLSSDADATLGRQSAWLAKYPSVNIQVAGNCDERGTETYNLALGQKRADGQSGDSKQSRRFLHQQKPPVSFCGFRLFNSRSPD
jgi:peptidoglycan-associated lipoprotein